MTVNTLSLTVSQPALGSGPHIQDAGTRRHSLPPDPELHRQVLDMSQRPISQVSAFQRDEWLYYLTIDSDLVEAPEINAILGHLQRAIAAHRDARKAKDRLRLRRRGRRATDWSD